MDHEKAWPRGAPEGDTISARPYSVDRGRASSVLFLH